MNFRPFSVAFLAFFILSSTAFSMGSTPVSEESQLLRVAIIDGKEKIHFQVKGHYEIFRLHTQELLEKGKDLDVSVTPETEGIRFGEKSFKIFGIRIIPQWDAAISVEGRRFRGVIDIVRQKNVTLLVINHLDIERYLYGVLPHEVPHHWPDAVLEVQAILARSYALYKKMEHQNRDYDVTATVLSQRYGGREEEKRRVRRAVDHTQGKVLTYNGTLFPTFYHSTCGGHTEDAVAASLWKKKLLPLQGVRCMYCEHSPFYRWERSFTLDDIEFRLKKAGYEVKGIQDLSIQGRTYSGRAESIQVTHQKGKTQIAAPAFRLAIGPIDLRSIQFDLEVKEKKVFLKGYGWGHGAGLCQWGAEGMARRGFSVQEILSFYYPGGEIRELINIPWN